MQLIRDAAKEIVTVLGVDVAVVAIDDGDPDGLPVASSYGFSAEVGDDMRLPRGPSSFARIVLESPLPVSVPDVDGDARFTLYEGLRGMIRSTAGVRMESGAQVYGAITVGSNLHRRFSDDDLHFHAAVANVMAAALDADRSARDLRPRRSPRSADRTAQPGAARRSPAIGAGAGRPLPQPRRRHGVRSRPVQGRQRHPRPQRR